LLHFLAMLPRALSSTLFPYTTLFRSQILGQCAMYIAAVRIADDFGCHTIGIQYQQGLKDLAPASDLAEGLLNNVDRPPVTARGKDRKSTRLNSSHRTISYAVFCLKKK